MLNAAPPASIAWTDVATAIGALVTATVVFLGLVFAFFQIRSADKARNIEALTARSEKWEEQSMVEARLAVSNIADASELRDRLGNMEPGKSEEWFLFMRIPHFFEDIGVACLKAHALSKELVYELFAPPIGLYWGWYKTFVEEFRENQEDQRLYEWFGNIALEMEQMEERRNK